MIPIELWQTPLSYRPLRITGKRCDSFDVIRDTKRPETRKNDVERFFHSEWFHFLTDADPDYLLDYLARAEI